MVRRETRARTGRRRWPERTLRTCSPARGEGSVRAGGGSRRTTGPPGRTGRQTGSGGIQGGPLGEERPDDGRCPLRSQREALPGAVQEGVHLLFDDIGGFPDRAGEEFGLLEDGRPDLGVPEPDRALAKCRLQCGPPGGCRGKNVPHPPHGRNGHGTFCASERYTTFRVESFPRYIAWSARFSRCCFVVACSGKGAIPMDIVRWIVSPISMPNASSAFVSTRSTTNSSPPYRTTVSVSRTQERSTEPDSTSTLVPTRCTCASLTRLKKSRSMNRTEKKLR